MAVVTFTISADDPKSIRAVELAAEADLWLTGRNRAGEDVYGVPSQADPSHYYIVTSASCDCPDYAHTSTACKHMLAVRLHRELVRAQQRRTQPARTRADPPRSRGHLSVVPRP
jgi:hypothetical protein